MGLLTACSDPNVVNPDDEASIEELLGRYLPKLSEAYATGDVEVLRDVAAEKELAGLVKRISDLQNEESRTVVPSLRSFDIEQVTIWNHSNAFVTTLEVWDLTVMASGTDHVLSEVEGQRNRVKYQLKRREDTWQVLHRAIETTFDD